MIFGEIKVWATCTTENGDKFTAEFCIRTVGKGMWKEQIATQIKNGLNSSGIKKRIKFVDVH